MLNARRLIWIGGLVFLVGGTGICRAEADKRDGEDPAAQAEEFRERRTTLLQQIKALEDKGTNRTLGENATLAALQTQVRQIETALNRVAGGNPNAVGTNPAGVSTNPAGVGTNPAGVGTGPAGIGGTPAAIGNNPGGINTGGPDTRGLDTRSAGLDGAAAGQGLGESKGPAPAGIKEGRGGLATGGAGGDALDGGGTGVKLGPAPAGIKDNPGGVATGGTTGDGLDGGGQGVRLGPAPAGIRDNPGGVATGGATGDGLDGGGTGVKLGAVPEGLKQNPGDFATALEQERKPKPEDDKPNWGKEPKPVDGGFKDPAPKEPKGKEGGPKDPHPKEIATIGGLAAAPPELGPPPVPGPAVPIGPPPKAGLAATEEGVGPIRPPPRDSTPVPPLPPPKGDVSTPLAGRLMEGLSFRGADSKLDEATAREMLKAVSTQVAKLHDSLGSGPAAGVASPLGLGKLAQGLLSQPLQKRADFAAMTDSLERLLGSLQARLKGGAQDARGVQKGTANRSELGADNQGAETARGDLKGAIAAELQNLGPAIDKQVGAVGAYNDNWTPEQKEAYMRQLNALQNKLQMLTNLNLAIHDITKGVIQNVR